MRGNKRIRRRQLDEGKHRERFAAYLRNKVKTYESRLERQDEESEEAVRLVGHIERLRRIVEELEAA